MRLMGLESTAPKPNTSKPAPEPPYTYHEESDGFLGSCGPPLTYIPMFVYVVAVIDCIRGGARLALVHTRGDDLLRRGSERSCGTLRLPRIFNTDQGSQHLVSTVYCLLLRSRSAWMAKLAVSTTSCGAIWRSRSTRGHLIRDTTPCKCSPGIARYFDFF